ncbi:YegP family protein [Neisseria elongata]|uniref:YegP family protein n=1 Tax=Neisseria elongata TaxID=495 RepID=UPI000D3487E3|nr:YegP family protein [Neisseria elongata]
MYFEIYKDAKGEYRWRLKAANHQIVAQSSEGYTTKQNCQHAIDLVKSTNADTPVKEV